MYKSHRVIYLRDTDAVGVLYFTEQLRLALEVFEEFLRQGCLQLKTIIEEKGFLMPIVHAEADFKASLRVGDAVNIELTLENMGASSFTLTTRFVDPVSFEEKGSTKIVHVVIDKRGWKAMPLPEELKNLILKI